MEPPPRLPAGRAGAGSQAQRALHRSQRARPCLSADAEVLELERVLREQVERLARICLTGALQARRRFISPPVTANADLIPRQLARYDRTGVDADGARGESMPTSAR